LGLQSSQFDKILLLQIDVEKLARYLALHLIAVVMDRKRDEALFQYLLSGLRLLHSLCDLAPRHPKIEQVTVTPVSFFSLLRRCKLGSFGFDNIFSMTFFT
jgi:hypothetical protein